MWRRQATGTVAEILGRREVNRDRGARLHQFRGDLDDELNRYHPRGKPIVEAYVRGMNAYIAETERNRRCCRWSSACSASSRAAGHRRW